MVDYVNRGPDKRILGSFGARLQAKLSFRSPHEPRRLLLRGPGGSESRWQLMIALSAPKWLPFVSVAVPQPFSARVLTMRVGWRYDKYWGDKTPCREYLSSGWCGECEAGRPWACLFPRLNPPPHGGYIADVIIKALAHVVHY